MFRNRNLFPSGVRTDAGERKSRFRHALICHTGRPKWHFAQPMRHCPYVKPHNYAFAMPAKNAIFQSYGIA
jgi:hypothetical protein